MFGFWYIMRLLNVSNIEEFPELAAGYCKGLNRCGVV